MKGPLKKFLPPILAILLFFFLGEILCRIFLPRPKHLVHIVEDADYKSSLTKTDSRTAKRVQTKPAKGLLQVTPSGFRLYPNMDAVIENHMMNGRNISIQTNSIGYRNRELKKKDKTRVLFLGDSITAGDYLDEEETYVRLLEKYSQKSLRPLETVNAGVPGVSLATELAILKETGVATEPDTVVLGFYLNDLRESFGIRIFEPPGILQQSRFLYYLFKTVSIALVQSESHEWDLYADDQWRALMDETQRQFPPGPGDLKTEPAAFNQEVINSFSDWGNAWNEKVWQHLSPLFKEFKALAQEKHFKPVIFIFPVRPQVQAQYDTDFPQQQLKAIAKALDIPVLDFLPIFREDFAKNHQEIFYDHCHNTPYGNKIIAERGLEFLLSQP